jgi:GGDEF domain-containing protein
MLQTAESKNNNFPIDPRERQRVERSNDKRMVAGETALMQVTKLKISGTSEVASYSNLKIPKRFRPLEDEANDWVGFSDFQSNKVRSRVEVEIEASQPGLYTFVGELDLNNFKGFNDTFGIVVGDGVIGNFCRVFATMLEKEIPDIPNVDIYRGPGDELFPIGKNLTFDQATRLDAAVKIVTEKIRYSGMSSADQEIPLTVSCTAFTSIVSNDDLISGAAENKYWDLRGSYSKTIYDINFGRTGRKIAKLDVLFGLMEDKKIPLKAESLVRDFKLFQTQQAGGVPSKLLHFENYLENQARQSNWMRDLYVVIQVVRGKLDTFFDHSKVQIGVKATEIEEVVALYMLVDDHNRKLVNRLASQGVIDMGKVQKYLEIDIENESISTLNRNEIKRYEDLFAVRFAMMRFRRGTVRV